MPTFEADIYLLNRVRCPAVTVIPGYITQTVDVLIGMEIIARGDFAITYPEDKTKFTFRIPRQADIDFVAEDRPKNTRDRMLQLAQENKARTARPMNRKGKKRR